MTALEDWQWLVIWASGALAWAFLAFVWIEDRDNAEQWAAAGIFWPLWLFAVGMALVMLSPFLPFWLACQAGRRVRAWATRGAL